MGKSTLKGMFNKGSPEEIKKQIENEINESNTDLESIKKIIEI